jgi:hypothetical protein
MKWTAIIGRFREWISEASQAMNPGEAGSNSATLPDLYTGLAVSPASFSRQLGELQTSLLRANTSQSACAEKDGGSAEEEKVAVKKRRPQSAPPRNYQS